ncbi:heterokaryon incompatibility protein-domain-containing protein [Xylaria bambusicola]|uniref:heterokaryon incompatibility protein-domain-containing protein n=1 Tax=Xylaria bambusicola TaxID=326684 RepID=UPI00200810CC|nr:heterokaryon incompatibility protein-domain-containing protein [Xylaria bambusicola]KAI0514459.1 heterokaryon incompatibility protein-domain-containing protein [Xylaria bambusicola]
MSPFLPNQSLNTARLCTICENASPFNDDQDFLREHGNTDGTGRLVASEDTAIRTSRISHLRDDTLPDLPQLHESSKRGCDFCGFLRSVITCDDTQDEIQRVFGTSGTDVDPLELSISIHFRWKYHYEQDVRGDGLLGAIILLCFDDGKVEIALFCLAEGISGSETSDVWLGLAAPPSQRFSQQHRLDWMAQILSECTEKHQHDKRGNNFVPERLIDVQNATPRLVLGADVAISKSGAQKPPYVALSYCWGPAEESKSQLKTTTSSIAKRQAAIQEAEMTEVLRDAIKVTRALSIPYLWVDALCILQDDISDWERQCADMAQLYQSAHVVLCAASSASCLQGFLGERGHRIRMPFQSTRKPSIVGSYYLHFKYAGWSRGFMFSEASADMAHNRWSNRGWVFQESWSASRRLVFGNSNLHLCCPSGVQSMGREREAKKEEPDENSLFLSRLDTCSREELYASWASLVRKYSRFEDHSFTKATDLLPALSGLASKYHEYNQDKYHAGLWGEDLFRGLMWYWDGDSEELPERQCCAPSTFMRHNEFSVPSWSPLARGSFVTHGAIYKDDECLANFQPEYTALEARTEPVGANPFGAIRDNWSLRIHSYVLDLATLNPQKLEVSEDFAGGEGSRGTLIYEGKHLGCFELDFVYDADDNCYNMDCVNAPACMLDEISRFRWVLLGSCKVRGNDENPERLRRARGACGLILFSPPGSDALHRVGVFLPGLPENHHDGLRLLRKLGEIRTIVVT